MDFGLLVIFLVGGSWLYASALLALADWRWNLGRVVVFALLASLSVRPALSTPVDPLWLVGLGAAFCVTVLLPQFASRRVMTLLRRGDSAGAHRWETLHALLTFRSPSLARRRLDEALRLLQHDWTTMRHARDHWLLRFRSAWSRSIFLTVWIEGLINIRENDRAIHLFEEHFGPGKLRATTVLLNLMVAPYAKNGHLRQALDCFYRGNAGTSAPSPTAELRRAGALLHLFAFAGRPEAVDELIARTPLLQVTLPSSHALLWRGVALMYRGHLEAAREALDRAQDYPPSDRAAFEAIVRRYQAMLSERESAPTLDPALERALDDLESEEARRLPRRLPAPTPRPAATLAIMVSCAMMWVAMEVGGSSLDLYTLVRFGANVSGLVKVGEWWRLISSIFLHVGLMHLVFNLWACHIFGSFVERMTGRWSIFIGFMVSGIVGSAASAFLGTHAISAGASGGVFGLLGMAIVLTLASRKTGGEMRRMQLFTFLFFAAINAAYGLMQPQVDNLAHAGGLAGGLLMGVLLRPRGHGIRRALMPRLISIALVTLLVSVAAHLLINLRSGGYPERVKVWRTYTPPKASWSLEVPAAWEVVEENKERVTFLDPIMAGFQVITLNDEDVAIHPEANERVREHRTIRAHGMEYEEAILLAQTDDGKKARFIYKIADKGTAYILLLECDAEMMEPYRDLAQRLPLTFKALNGGGDAAAEASASGPPANAPLSR